MKLFRHRWVRLVALFGVMLHAHALTGHNASAMSMAFAKAQAPAGYVVICRADGGTETIAFEQLFNGGSSKTSKPVGCPLCCGAMPAFAVDAPSPVVLARMPRAIETPTFVENAALPVARAARPPATGPPALV